MSEYLFIFTIGPVKEFIASSRKSQDLFAGSALLSHLSGLAMDETIRLFKSDEIIIITPSPGTKFRPNRFVAKINASSKSFKDIGDQIERSVVDDFKRISNLPFNKKSLTKPDGYDLQINHLLEISWLFYPIEKDYRTAYKRLFLELAAIKNVTPFKTLNETGRKCSVDGQLNVKIYRKDLIDGIEEKLAENKLGMYSKLFQKPEDVRAIGYHDKSLKIWHIEGGEGLSAVSLTKRIFNPSDPTELSQPHIFPSTAKISLLNWINKVNNLPEFIEYNEFVICSIKSERNLFQHSDDQLYYRENIEQIVDKIDSDLTQQCIQYHQNLHDSIKKQGISEPMLKYYALIRFDGDNMGDWLLGKNLKPGSDLEEFHKKLSVCIDQFATKISEFINNDKGKVIYAGGEDFMAMVNVQSLFEVMTRIQELYKEEINDQLIDYRKESDLNMTVSLGGAIAHYKQPLPMVLDRAKAMEGKAKNDGRNRYAIGIMKHSGSSLDFSLPWLINDTASLKVILRVINRLKDKSFSTACLRNIASSIDEYGDNMLPGLIFSKIKLYVPRSANFSNDEKALSEMIADFKQLYDLTGGNNHTFANLLLVLDFLIRKTKN